MSLSTFWKRRHRRFGYKLINIVMHHADGTIEELKGKLKIVKTIVHGKIIVK